MHFGQVAVSKKASQLQPVSRAALPFQGGLKHRRGRRGFRPVSKVHALSGLGQWEAIAAQAAGAYMQGQSGGGSTGGAGGAQQPSGPQSTSKSTSAVQATISPTIATQISPQISPSFVQQFQPSGSAVTTGASQGGSPMTMPGSVLPAGNATTEPTLMPAQYLPPPIQIPSAGFNWEAWKWPIVGAALLLIAVPILKRKRAAH